MTKVTTSKEIVNISLEHEFGYAYHGLLQRNKRPDLLSGIRLIPDDIISLF